MVCAENSNLRLLSIPQKYPAMIVDDEIFQVWYKLDDKVKTPKVMVDIELMSPKVMSSVERSVCSA